MAHTSHVTSADGTRIEYERTGEGPPLVMVDAAGSYRGFGPMTGLSDLLAAGHTVFTYDRRGRGASGDAPPYLVDREVEDLAAVVDAAGGTASIYAFSSGGLLAMQAVVAGLSIPRMVLFEPPIQMEADPPPESDLTREMVRLIEAGRPDEAAMHFQRSIGVPAEILDGMRDQPFWPDFVAVAHTLVYDCKLSDATSLDTAAKVTVPALILDSQGSSDDLTGWAASVAAAMPSASHLSMEGEWHGIPHEALAPVVTEFLLRSATP